MASGANSAFPILGMSARRPKGEVPWIEERWVSSRPCVDGSPLARVFWCLCNAGWCDHVSDLFVRQIPPLAVMPSAYQVPTICSHSRCWVEMGSPDPAVSTGLLHQLPFALPKLVSATVAALCFAVSLRRCRHGLNDLWISIAFAADHQRPHRSGGLVGERDSRNLRWTAAY